MHLGLKAMLCRTWAETCNQFTTFLCRWARTQIQCKQSGHARCPCWPCRSSKRHAAESGRLDVSNKDESCSRFFLALLTVFRDDLRWPLFLLPLCTLFPLSRTQAVATTTSQPQIRSFSRSSCLRCFTPLGRRRGL